MRTFRAIYFAMLVLVSLSCNAQVQKFDLISYASPKGWKKQAGASALQIIKQDQRKGTYCIITLYKAFDAAGEAKENFNTAWESLVKETLQVKNDPEMQAPATENGWEAQTGYAAFEDSGSNGVAVLTTLTGYNKMVNILILTNTDVYQNEMDSFLKSISLAKPKISTNTNANANANANANTSTDVQAVSNSSTSNGFAYSRTNFDDGWVSIVKEDWVEASKPDIKVYLWYALPYNASDFSGTGVRDRDYFWDNYVTKYFTVQSKQYRDNGEIISSLQPNYVEGWAIDKQTGERRFIAMRLSIAPNAALLNIASAKDEATLRKEFPNANGQFTSDLADMSRYNKFAISKNDVIGKWVRGSSSMMNWYSTVTGNNVGATAVAMSDEFNFGSDGKYNSVHNGASGVVGAMSTYHQEYKGNYTVTDWTLTATNRFNGQTTVYSAWFEVVRGGRILHFQDQQYTGMKLSLGKVK